MRQIRLSDAIIFLIPSSTKTKKDKTSPLQMHCGTLNLLTLATICVVLGLIAPAQCQERLSLHIDDRGVYTRAGYFNGRYFYRGGVPKIHTKVENYDCIQTCTSNASCSLSNRPQYIASPYCILWSVREYGYDDASGVGTCKCTRGTSHFCAAYTCDQSVTSYNTVCDDFCFAVQVTSGKFKSCSCDDFPLNVTGSPRCSAWTCLGYGDGPVKTAYWSCYKSVSQLQGLSAPTTLNNDFCWFFGSDQDSTAINEVKDCQCVSVSTTGSYCDSWVCYGRYASNWIWYSSLIASPIAAALNLWVPILIRVTDSEAVVAMSGVWCLLTYLLIVLLGGLPSLIANTAALCLVSLIVNCDRLLRLYRSHRRENGADNWEGSNQPSADVIMGVRVCPTCKRPLEMGETA